jgi:hypothetical protein
MLGFKAGAAVSIEETAAAFDRSIWTRWKI